MRQRTLRRSPLAAGLLTLAFAGTTAAQQPADTAGAAAALRDFAAACGRDGGALWGRTLCGSIVLVHRETRFAVANDSPPSGAFTRKGPLWRGRAPDSLALANTSTSWGGRPWAIGLLPLGGDRFEQVDLLAHESFHRIQDSLGLGGPDLLAVHLDERDGRYWFRLELRALAAAIRSKGAPARRAAADALLFRARRYELYPAADSLERALELQEGLAEYTGVKIALAATAEPQARVAVALREFELRPTYVRSAAYATGPGVGLLLDRYAPRWRTLVKERALAPQLARALHWTPPRELASAAARRSGAYDGTALARAEDARADERARRFAAWRSRYIDGPVLVLRQQGLQRAFNPNTLAPFGEEGTIYPTGTFSAAWGVLDVTDGALVAGDFGSVRVPAPADSTGRPLSGPGWTLQLADGWTLTPGPRTGDYELAPPP
jgi:hypothetical protein